MENQISGQENNNTTEVVKKKRNIMPFIMAFLLVVIAFIGIKKIMYGRENEDTENSQLECNITSMVSKVPGYVTVLNIKDNQYVHKGDTLLKIDDREWLIKVTQAEIALANATANIDLTGSNVNTADANVIAANSNILTAQANVEAAKVKVWKTTQDFDRYKKLYDLNSATAQQLDNATAEKESAEKQLEITIKQLNASKSVSAVSSAQMGSSQKQISLAALLVKQRQTELDNAKLQLSYATIIAPSDGFIAKKNVQMGQLITSNTPLFALVDDSYFWVTANFKETQIEKLSVGQSVKIELDAYPNGTFTGTVESLSPAAGSKFALLPPDNATGNFVKVVQRIPVKIKVNKEDKDKYPLRAGMNAKVIVKVK
jgi:membrane fusion protein (multidrug efflux system)